MLCSLYSHIQIVFLRVHNLLPMAYSSARDRREPANCSPVNEDQRNEAKTNMQILGQYQT